MPTLPTITVTPEAATHIAALKLQVAVDHMVDHARQAVPELDRIEVLLYDRYELGDEPGIAVEAYSHRPFDPSEQVDQELDRWMVAEFPGEVLQHVILCYRPGVPYAG
jgi:hypothetical protein